MKADVHAQDSQGTAVHSAAREGHGWAIPQVKRQLKCTRVNLTQSCNASDDMLRHMKRQYHPAMKKLRIVTLGLGAG
jgi:hypothetical protein